MAAVLLGAILLLSGCRSRFNEYQMSEMAMGTLISGTVYIEGEGEGETVTRELARALDVLETEKLSWKLEGSEIFQVNQEGCGEVSEETASYLNQVLKLCEDSGGAVDPTMGKVIELWDFDNGAGKVPDKSEIEKYLRYADYRKVAVQGQKVAIPDNTALNLGAVGKGIGSDVMSELLKKQKQVKGAVLSLGNSSIVTYGNKPDGADWKVALTDPSGDAGSYLGVLEFSGTHFISTSGNYEKYFMKDGVRYHHILDPATGYPVENGLTSVTVIGDSGLLCDGLSTACFVLGVEKGQKLLKKYGVEGIFADEDKNIILTDGAKGYFSLLNKDYNITR